MKHPNKLYPQPATSKEVIDSAIEHLPITSQNDLIALLKTFENAIAKETEPTKH